MLQTSIDPTTSCIHTYINFFPSISTVSILHNWPSSFQKFRCVVQTPQDQFPFTATKIHRTMFRRGQSCGGGYSSLGYLFGGDDKPPPRAIARPTNRGGPQQLQQPPPPIEKTQHQNNNIAYESYNSSKSTVISPDERPAAGKVYHDERYDTEDGRMGRVTNNNYHRPDSQNCGNFITDRPTTRVQSSPGGQSSLGYLFG